MSKKKMVTIDGNTAAAHVAYAFSEVAAIYPITPSSPMGENTDAWASVGLKNVFGKKVDLVEMQSEAGAAGAVHGSLSCGALTTTFTASQGLLLMIPNMHKIAGEMLPTVFHVSARSLAAQSLSIFGDHSDVMSIRNTGFGITAASSIQETMDLALVAHLATLKSQIPFVSFFDGFRTSHEVQKVEQISFDTIESLIEPEYIEQFRNRAMRPENPIIKVAAQNQDVYFQGRETVNKYYDATPGIVQEYMDKVAAVIGRQYHLFDYVGAPDAEKVIISMGSSCDTVEHTINYMVSRGEKVGAIKVRLYRPFSVEAFLGALPKTCKKIAVLDRTKEPGSIGEPLYLDIVASMAGKDVKVIGGRYGLSSKEFTPGYVKAVFNHLDGKAFHNFTVGINDDVTNRSIDIQEVIDVVPSDVVSCLFWGLGADGTVGAAKNSIKIIGGNTSKNAQAYFTYDSKKSGGITVSHLRFGDSSVNMPWLIDSADFVGCHNHAYIGKYDMLKPLKEGGTFILNSRLSGSDVFESLTRDMQEEIIAKKIKFYTIDAFKIAEETGLGVRINTVMQAAFFKVSGILPEDEAIRLIKKAIGKTFARKGDNVIKMNWDSVDRSVEALERVEIPVKITKSFNAPPLIPSNADNFAKNVIDPVMRLKGDDIPVSQMSFDGTIQLGTSVLEKRGVASSVASWVFENCIQCNHCVMSCPHAAIRAKQIVPLELDNAPENFTTTKSNTKNGKDLQFKIQVYVDDCQGCGVCVEVCPSKIKSLIMSPLDIEKGRGEIENYKFFNDLPNNILDGVKESTVKGTQFKTPLFEFSGACAGCGETPYIKLITQLYGENIIAANATGCSSIYGGTFPTVPYCKADNGRGPTWGNSLFEDNAEYGFGMRLAVDSNRALLKNNVKRLLELGTSSDLTASLKKNIHLWDEKSSEAILAQTATGLLIQPALRDANEETKKILAKITELKDYFIDKSIWIIGGDGWAYDIGYGGLDHVVAAGRNVNILVLDTEVYSNTGGQASKATPIAAVAKFANSGMRMGKKNLAMMCITYGYVYVASIAMGANRNQTQKAIMEAEAYNGPSIIIAYSPCIAHGIDMSKSQVEQKKAVESGYWPLFRYNPEDEEGNRFKWDAKEPVLDYQDFLRGEARYSALFKTVPEEAEALFNEAELDAKRRMNFYKKLGTIL